MAQVVTDVRMPVNYTDAEIAAFCCFVKQGDEVDGAGLEERVRRAASLSFLYVDQSLVAVAALKRPDSGYRDGVFRKATSEHTATDFDFELGWVFVPPEHRKRGYSQLASIAVMSQAAGAAAFATTRATNEAMKKTLRKIGFIPDGETWKSARGDYNLVLFVLPANSTAPSTANGS